MSSSLLLLSLAVFALSCTIDPATLDGPTQAIVGPDGRIYVSDGYFNARIAVFDLDGRLLDSWGTKGSGRHQLNTPHGLAFTSAGELLVADRDNGRIVRYTRDGELLGIWQGSQLGRPWSVAVAADGAIFAVDGGDQDPDAPRSGLVELSPDGTVRQRFSGLGVAPGLLDEGHMLAVADDRALYVVDLGGGRVQKFTPADGCSAVDGSCAYEVLPGWPALTGALRKGARPSGIRCSWPRLRSGVRRGCSSSWEVGWALRWRCSPAASPPTGSPSWVSARRPARAGGGTRFCGS